MTVGSLFLLIISLIVILLGVAYILYRLEVKRLKKRGYYNLSDAASFGYWMFVSYLTATAMFVFGFLLYKVITNWNMPI